MNTYKDFLDLKQLNLLNSFIDWMRTKPPATEYTISSGCDCLFAQFFHEELGERGYIDIRTISATFGFNAFNVIATGIDPIISDGPNATCTFAKAIKRAEAIISLETPIHLYEPYVS